jgi:hypothetical protein
VKLTNDPLWARSKVCSLQFDAVKLTNDPHTYDRAHGGSLVNFTASDCNEYTYDRAHGGSLVNFTASDCNEYTYDRVSILITI